MSYEYSETVREAGNRRVIIVSDADAEQPYDNGGPHVFRVEADPYGVRPTVELAHHSWQRKAEADSLADALSEAFTRWGRDGDKVLRYLRVWHDVVAFDYVAGQNAIGTFYGIVTRGLAEAWGVSDPDGVDANLDDWQAWLDGDVWGYVVQERVTWTAEGHEPRVEWEATDESCWGFYGAEHARDAALEAFDVVAARRHYWCGKCFRTEQPGEAWGDTGTCPTCGNTRLSSEPAGDA